MNTHPQSLANARRAGFGSLAFWLGLWAVVIGLVSLYLGIDARNVANDAERRMERNVELLDESRVKIEELEIRVRESLDLTEQRVKEITFTAEQNATRLKTTADQLSSTRRVVSELIENLTAQKQALTEFATRIPAIPKDVQTQRTQPPPEITTSDTSNRTPTPTQPTETEPKEPTTYTVQSGDTLVDIARRKNLSVPDLLDANPRIDPNVIRVGQKLNLPD